MVITDVNQITYNGDGVTTAWPFTFKIIDATDLKLTLINAAGARTDITSDYYVDLVNSTVYYPGYAPGAEPPEADQPPKVQSGEKIMLYRRVPVNQLADLGDAWPFTVIEKGLDKLTMIAQDIYSWIGRNIVGLNEDGTEWDAKGLPISNVGGPVNVDDAATKDYVDKILNGIIESGDGRVIPYDDVAQLRSGNLVPAQIATTLGYHDINDGGAGVYSIRAKVPTDVDNGGSLIILDNGNVANLIVDGKVNIKQFGAKGDGVTDDTTAFTNAIAFATNVTLVVPDGNYLITENLFADIDVEDNGSYADIKPAYHDKNLLIKSFAGFGRANTINQADTTVHPQGMTYDTKRGVLICAMVKSDSSAQTLLTIDPSTYTVTATDSFTDIGHVNSLAYCPDNDKLYSAKFVDGNTAGSPYIAVVDASTMTYEETIDVSQTVGFLDYDKECKCFVGGNWTELNGLIADIFIWDKDWNLLKQFNIYKESQQTRFNGSILAHNGHAVLLNPESLIEFDYFGNVLQRTDFTLGNQQTLGSEYELEDITTDGNGNIYIDVPHLVVGAATKLKIYRYNDEIEANNGDFSMIARGGAVFVPDDTSLNRLTDPGYYMVQMSAPGSADCHFPEGRTSTLGVKNGLLQVIGEGTNSNYIYLRQIFYERNNPGLIFERRYTKGYNGNVGWTPWIELTHTTQSFTVGLFTVAPSTQKNYKVTFGTPFNGVPIVVATVYGDNTNNFIVTVDYVTTTDFILRVKNINTTETKTCYVSWVAVNRTALTYGNPSFEEV